MGKRQPGEEWWGIDAAASLSLTVKKGRDQIGLTKELMTRVREVDIRTHSGNTPFLECAKGVDAREDLIRLAPSQPVPERLVVERVVGVHPLLLKD